MYVYHSKANGEKRLFLNTWWKIRNVLSRQCKMQLYSFLSTRIISLIHMLVANTQSLHIASIPVKNACVDEFKWNDTNLDVSVCSDVSFLANTLGTIPRISPILLTLHVLPTDMVWWAGFPQGSHNTHSWIVCDYFHYWVACQNGKGAHSSPLHHV